MDQQNEQGKSNITAFPGTNKHSVPGMSPQFVAKWDRLVDDVDDVINKAIKAQLPPQLIMGQLRIPATVPTAIEGWSDELMADWRHLAERLQIAVARAEQAGIPKVLIIGQLEGSVADILDCMLIEGVPQ